MPTLTSFSNPFGMFNWVPTRVSVALLTMLGMINILMVRVNLSFAIVAMVRRNLTSLHHTKSQCSTNQTLTDVTFSEDLATTEASGGEGQDITLSPALLADSEMGGMEGELDWDEVTQALVLGAFFYGYWVTQVFGGRLAELYGTRVVFGVCVLAGGLSAVFTPLAARTHYGILISLRVVQGLFQGSSLPCIFPLMVRWFPLFERSRFIAYILFCNNLSITMTLPLCGLVISAYGWDAAFYVTGALSLAWCLLWFSCMYDTPDQHPRISAKELDYIQGSEHRMCRSNKPKDSVPWMEMANSLPVWAILICEAGNSFGFSVYFSYIPTYLKNILGFSIKENGMVSALPYLCRYLGAIIAATVGEHLLTRRVLSIITTRRIFSAIAMFGPALNLLVVSYSGCDSFFVIALLCLGFFLNGSITIGLFANRIDITNNFSGTLSGIANCFANIIAFIVPLVVGALTQNQQTMGQWQKVFWMCVPIYTVCEVIFLVFASGSLQKWNDEGESVESVSEEEEEEKLEVVSSASAEEGKVM